MNMNFGGPIKRDKAWFHSSWRKQFNAVENAQFNFDKTFDTWNTNPSAKVTYQLNQNHKLIGYYQWNMKTQPNRLPLGTYFYDNPGQTVRQESPSWVYKAEWNGTLSDKLYLEARWRRLRLLRPAPHQQRRAVLLARQRHAAPDRRARAEPDRP